jgi:hypothetical protein
MVFYFSCKNKSSKVYTSFAEIVVLVTQSTAKLGLQFLDFSTNWYWIYKSLDSRAKLGRIFLCLGPWNFWNFKNIPLHLTPRPSGTNPLHNCTPPPAAGQARRWRGRAGGGKQERGMGDWTHVCPIRDGGSGGEASSDGRRRGSGSTLPWLGLRWNDGDARPSSAIGGSHVG